jgi:hypothetical protein
MQLTSSLGDTSVHEIKHKTPAISLMPYSVGNSNVNEYSGDQSQPTQMHRMFEDVQEDQAFESPPTREAFSETEMALRLLRLLDRLPVSAVQN